MAFNNAIGGGKPQSGSLADGFGGEKRIKTLLKGLTIHTFAGIGNRHRNPIIIPRRFYGQLTATRHSITGIGTKIHKGLTQTGRVPDNRHMILKISQNFDFFLIAPATANTVAKISLGIADTLLCNAAIMALKAFVPVYVMPSDYQEGITITKLPNGRDMRLKIRKEDVAHVNRLSEMEGIGVLKTPDALYDLFTDLYIQ